MRGFCFRRSLVLGPGVGIISYPRGVSGPIRSSCALVPLETPNAPKHQLAYQTREPRGAILHTTRRVEAGHIPTDSKVGVVEMVLKPSFHLEGGRTHEGRTFETSCLCPIDASCPVGVASRNGGGRSADER